MSAVIRGWSLRSGLGLGFAQTTRSNFYRHVWTFLLGIFDCVSYLGYELTLSFEEWTEIRILPSDNHAFANLTALVSLIFSSASRHAD